MADLSRLVVQMANNTKPKQQQMRIQSSVTYPSFDTSQNDDAELAINSLSVLRDLGYSTSGLIIGFCYQKSLTELLLALTSKQKTNFEAFAAEFRRWYGINPATAQAEYDRLRQRPGENEIALWERISRCFRQCEGRQATVADNYKLVQKFIDSLTNEQIALQLRSKFLRDEFRSTSAMIREAMSIRQAVETQNIRNDNRKQELRTLLQYANPTDFNSSPMVATTVHDQNRQEGKFCKRCHTNNHNIEDCTPTQDLYKFNRYCKTHGWGMHDTDYCKGVMRPTYLSGNRSKQGITWGDRHQQQLICPRCGGPHEQSQCRANQKQVSDFNKVKSGIKPSKPEVTFNLPSTYGPGAAVPNSSFYMADNIDGGNWSVQYMNEDEECERLRFDDDMDLNWS